MHASLVALIPSFSLHKCYHITHICCTSIPIHHEPSPMMKCVISLPSAPLYVWDISHPISTHTWKWLPCVYQFRSTSCCRSFWKSSWRNYRVYCNERSTSAFSWQDPIGWVTWCCLSMCMVSTSYTTNCFGYGLGAQLNLVKKLDFLSLMRPMTLLG